MGTSPRGRSHFGVSRCISVPPPAQASPGRWARGGPAGQLYVPRTFVRAVCATKRMMVSPAQRGLTRKEVSGSDGLPEIERLKGTIAC